MSILKVESFFYPVDFVRRVKQAFPNDESLHQMLDNNAVFTVEFYLKRSNRQDLFQEQQKLWNERPRMIGLARRV